MSTRRLSFAGALLLAGLAACSSPDGAPPAQPAAVKVDETKLVVLTGNTHPKAIAQYDVGPLDDAFPLDHLQLVLKRSPEREAALVALIDQLQDPKSPSFHQWLTPSQFADSFGVPAADIATVSGWLASHGLQVDRVAPNRMFIEFSGTAGLVGETFHTSIHRLMVSGKEHFGNMSDPKIPEALANVVVGVHALHDFMPHPMHKDLGAVRRDGNGKWGFVGSKPTFTFTDNSSTYYAVAPADFATIYNLNPLFAQGYRGAGQTIIVIEDTNIENPSDVTSFRTSFGLSGYAGTFSQVNPDGCTSPGVNDDEGEAALDAEWAGATAPDANIVLASCKDTTVFGGLTALQNILSAVAPDAGVDAGSGALPIISISYGECESALGAANASYVTTYQQAAAQGISIFVSSGDEGAASCDADKTVATHGITVSGFASTQYNVAVGGTDFMDQYNADQDGGPALSKYWSATNTTTDAGLKLSSAKSYIPEIPWNDSCASKLIYTQQGYADAGPAGAGGFCSSTAGKADFLTTTSGSGGPSIVTPQPSWQAGVPGLPTASGGTRYLPDLSLFAANGIWGHFYIYCMSDADAGGGPCNYASGADTVALAAGGTSFASPAMAGIQALVNQKAGSSQGNPNPVYYKLAAAQADGGACNSDQGTPLAPVPPSTGCVFNDVTKGDMDVPCTGSTNCFGYSKSKGVTTYGALSSTTGSLTAAYPAGAGWDFATGLGSLNAYNLVMSWPEGMDGGTDAGSEASVDAGVEAGPDAGPDAGVEAGVDAGVGVGTDSGLDASADATLDSGADASSEAGGGASAEASVDASADATVDAGPSCTCSGVGMDGPVTLSCGQTSCGEDDNTYLCGSGGWSFEATGCAGGGAGDAATCSCSGVGASGPVTLSCGQTSCGEDYNTYLCGSGGWSFEATGCAGGGAADAASCSCSGVGASGPVTLSCGQTSCGEDDNTYRCGSGGWSFEATGCAGGGTADAASCSCSGVGASGPVTLSCGQTSCGEDYNTYLCGSGGWSFEATGCAGGGAADAASCSCSGVGASGPVTLSCGQTSCGEDDNTYLCGSGGWSFDTAGCSN